MNSVQISSAEVSTATTGLPESGSSQISPAETRQSKTTIIQHSANSDCSFQISFSQIAESQSSTTQDCITQIDLSQIGSNQDRTAEIDPSQISIAENNSQISAFKLTIDSKIDSGEIPLTSSVTLKHFFNSHLFHNSLPQIDTLLQNTTLEITDLPPGQLAEGQLTSFDAQGLPNGGTILIDKDANGVGWFIDSTPLDNSEFSQIIGDNAFSATSNSEAYGRYDLLTAILHETAHLLGFIEGYEPFDIYRSSSPYAFTENSSHLNSTLYPHDLLNASLKTGTRILPSALDLEILQAIGAITSENNNQNKVSKSTRGLNRAIADIGILSKCI